MRRGLPAACAVAALLGWQAIAPARAAPGPRLANPAICADMRKLAQTGPFKVDEGRLSAQDRADIVRARRARDKSGSAAPDAMAQGILKMMTGDGGKGAPSSAQTLQMLGC